MSDKPSLLPPNATQLQRDVEQVNAEIDDLPIYFRDLWNPETCPLDLLPWLAWSLSVDDWDDNWSEEVKRRVVKESYGIHRQKGTVSAVRRALASLGYTSIKIVEPKKLIRDGTYKRDGSIKRGSDLRFPNFDVYLNIGIRPTPEQVQVIRRYIDNYKPVRSTLRHLRYATRLRDGTYKRDGSIKRDGGFVNG